MGRSLTVEILRSKGHNETKIYYGQINTLESTILLIFGMHLIYVFQWNNKNEISITNNYSLPGPHDNDNISKVISSKVKVTDNMF